MATLAFLIILGVIFFLNEKNRYNITRIENGYYPSLEIHEDFERILTSIQRDLKDAVASGDVDILAETDSLYVRFLKGSQLEYKYTVQEKSELDQLSSEFSEYYKHAKNISMRMITENIDEDLLSDLSGMEIKYNRIKENIHIRIQRDKSQFHNAFASTLQNFKNSIYIITATTLLFIIILLVVSQILNRAIAKPVYDIISAANQFSAGKMDIQIKVTAGDEIGILENTLNSMMERIRSSHLEIERESWIKSGQTEIHDILRGEQDETTLAQNIINYLAGYLNVQIGAIFLINEKNLLNLVGSYAYKTPTNIPIEFRPGEGLIGQAFLEKKNILINEVPDNYIKINSGLGQSAPTTILVKPFLYEGKVKGVIELGSFRQFTDVQLEYLDRIAENIAIVFHSVQSRIRMKKLLEKTQQLAEKLQNQQEELRQTNVELEEKTESLEKQKRDIKNKNKDLQNAQQIIEERAKQLELASKYKSEFLANMSHELRTPLNSLLILSKLLFQNKDNNLTEKQIEFARTIHKSGTDLLNLINDILDISKIEAGKIEINEEEVDFKNFTSDIEQNFKHLIKDKSLDFTVKVDNNLPLSLRTDRLRLEQIIKNFLSNAIKFTEKGGISLAISRPSSHVIYTTPALRTENSVAFSVTDNGKGIAREKQQLIFEAFQQEDGTTSRKYGGTGLGLSISKELAKILGGEIQLESEEGKGSTFTLYLPCEKADAISDQKISDKAASPSMKTLIKQKMDEKSDQAKASETEFIRDDRKNILTDDKSILIIDDDIKFAKILYDLAHEKGFKCLTAERGKKGLQLAFDYKPSAIILDIGLPDIDGWTVMERLKENAETRHIPVHFISAADETVVAKRMGAIGYLVKPVNLEDIEEAFNKIEKIIARQLKKLLVVEKDKIQLKKIIDLIGDGDVQTTAVGSGLEAFDLLKSNSFDCVIMDPDLDDISGFDILQKISNSDSILHLPIIIFTDKEISREQEQLLKKYSEFTVIKGVKSQERLLDETTLFLHQVEANLPEEKQKILRMIHDKDTIFHNKKILLVDDDMRNVFAISSILEEKGMKVSVGKNGREALEQLDKNPDFDLVIMDIMMPEMDGYEAMQKIRAQQKFTKLPIIALTAKAMKGDRNKCIEAGANDYLAKPVIDPDRLLSLIRVWLYQ